MNNQAQALHQAGVEQTYFNRLKQGRFEIQYCCTCKRHVFYPRELCPHCGCDGLEWVAPSGRGVVYSYTTIRRKPEAGGDYNVSLVDLEEGVRMMACVTGVPIDQIAIGMAVHVVIIIEKDGVPMVVFEGGLP